jgi:hypothetical protein
MTTNSGSPAYTAPSGFYQSYTYDGNGNVFADGKQLSGVNLGGQRTAKANNTNPNASTTPRASPYGQGGSILGLSIDDQGRVYATMPGAPAGLPALGAGVGSNPGINGANNGTHMSMGGLVSDNPQSIVDQLMAKASQPTTHKVLLSGIALDPNYTSKNPGALGDNQAYLRQEQDGMYYAQVDQGGGTVAYGYSAYQGAKAPTGGPAQASTARRQGGNAGGGAGPSATTGVSLLGS